MESKSWLEYLSKDIGVCRYIEITLVSSVLNCISLLLFALCSNKLFHCGHQPVAYFCCGGQRQS